MRNLPIFSRFIFFKAYFYMRLFLLLSIFSLSLLQSCSSMNSALGGNSTKEARAEVSWGYEKDAILIDLVMDPDLNLYGNQAHTLVLGVYQLADESSYQKLVANREIVLQSLSLGISSDSTIQLDRYAVSPGKRTTLKINRAQGTKYVGVIAGYYNLVIPTSSYVFRIPVNMESTGLISKSYTAIPSVLAFRLYLGKNTIVNAESLTYDANKKAIIETLPLENAPQKMVLTPSDLNQSYESTAAATKL